MTRVDATHWTAAAHGPGPGAQLQYKYTPRRTSATSRRGAGCGRGSRNRHDGPGPRGPPQADTVRRLAQRGSLAGRLTGPRLPGGAHCYPSRPQHARRRKQRPAARTPESSRGEPFPWRSTCPGVLVGGRPSYDEGAEPGCTVILPAQGPPRAAGRPARRRPVGFRGRLLLARNRDLPGRRVASWGLEATRGRRGRAARGRRLPDRLDEPSRRCRGAIIYDLPRAAPGPSV